MWMVACGEIIKALLSVSGLKEQTLTVNFDKIPYAILVFVIFRSDKWGWCSSFFSRITCALNGLVFFYLNENKMLEMTLNVVKFYQWYRVVKIFS